MFIKIMYFVQLVSDQDKALDFYTELGFEKRVDFPGPEGRFLTLGLEMNSDALQRKYRAFQWFKSRCHLHRVG